MASNWTRGLYNYVKIFDDFFVSYNPDTAVMGIGMFDGDGADETALCKGGKFFILNGDFRDDYDRLGPQGFDACLAFFKDHSEQKSSWSDAA